MISFRYHVVSIVAVFLALALGVVVGTTALNGPITKNLRDQVDSLKKDRSNLSSENKTLNDAADDSDQFAATFGSRIVAGTLKGKKVVLISMPGASGSIKDGVSKEISAAGATVTGAIQITGDFTSQKRADEIRSTVTSDNVHPIGWTAPTTDDVGTLGGSLLGWVLLSGEAQATDITTVVSAFSKLQVIKPDQTNIGAADLAVVISSGTLPVNDPGGKTQLSFVSALTSKGGHEVVAGDTDSATTAGLISLIRGNDATKGTLSTVDDADTAMGQVTSVLALAEAETGQSGAYGNAPGAQNLFPSTTTTAH